MDKSVAADPDSVVVAFRGEHGVGFKLMWPSLMSDDEGELQETGWFYSRSTRVWAKGPLDDDFLGPCFEDWEPIYRIVRH